MRVLIIFVLIACFATTGFCASEEFKNYLESIRKKCVAETGVNEELIDKLNNEKVLVDDANFRNYVKCVFVEFGMFTDDGQIDVPKILKLTPAEYCDVWAPVLKACGTKAGADLVETAWLTNKCYIEKTGKDYVMV